MKISIITVAFNAESTIAETIDSVLGQKNVDVEYIIIDGGSTDGTKEIVSAYGERISHFISEADQGIYDGMNKGLAKASGEIVGILNADDVYSDESVLEKVVDTFSDEVDALYGDLVYVAFNDLSKIKRTWVAKPYKVGAFRKGWMPPHPTFFVRKGLYSAHGAFTLKLKSAADYELMLRFIHKHKIRLAYIPQVLVKMRVGGESNASFKNRLRANKEDRLAWKMNNLKAGTFTFIRKPLSKISQFFKR